MKRAIAVCTWSGAKDLTDLCLSTSNDWKYPIVIVMLDAENADQAWVDYLQSKYHVIPVFENAYELGAIQAVYEQTDIEEFWFMQHSVQIIRPEVFDIAFYNKGKSISYAYNQFENYLGKYIRSTLDKVEIPKAPTKWHALYYESQFHLTYCNAESEDGRILCIDENFYADNPNNYVDPKINRYVQVGQYLLKRRSLDPRYYGVEDLEAIRSIPGLEDWQPNVFKFLVETSKEGP